MPSTTLTNTDYRIAAEGQLFFARMAELYGDNDGADAHTKLADLYISSAIKAATQAVASH